MGLTQPSNIKMEESYKPTSERERKTEKERDYNVHQRGDTIKLKQRYKEAESGIKRDVGNKIAFLNHCGTRQITKAVLMHS